MKGKEVRGEEREALSPDEEREMYENENMEDEEIEKGKGSSLR